MPIRKLISASSTSHMAEDKDTLLSHWQRGRVLNILEEMT